MLHQTFRSSSLYCFCASYLFLSISMNAFILGSSTWTGSAGGGDGVYDDFLDNELCLRSLSRLFLPDFCSVGRIGVN